MPTTTPSGRRGIGALSQRTGCNIETIRYYERIGLLSPAGRSEDGDRVYTEAHARGSVPGHVENQMVHSSG